MTGAPAPGPCVTAAPTGTPDSGTVTGTGSALPRNTSAPVARRRPSVSSVWEPARLIGSLPGSTRTSKSSGRSGTDAMPPASAMSAKLASHTLTSCQMSSWRSLGGQSSTRNTSCAAHVTATVALNRPWVPLHTPDSTAASGPNISHTVADLRSKYIGTASPDR